MAAVDSFDENWDLVDGAQWNNDAVISIIYEAPGLRGTGSRTSMVDRHNVETGVIMNRFSNKKWVVVKRSSFTLTGETDSYDATYVGVPMRARASVPTMPPNGGAALSVRAPAPTWGSSTSRAAVIRSHGMRRNLLRGTRRS